MSSSVPRRTVRWPGHALPAEDADGDVGVALHAHPANNFDSLRLLAAGMVLCSHQFALTGRPEPRVLGLMKLGTFGVLVFFVISGYLVAQSWDRDPHPLRFAAKRLLRIWPGLAVVTCVAAWLLGPLVTDASLRDYFHSPVTWDYFAQLVFAVRLHLPGVFEHSPYPAVNGSLWTIPIEVQWYGALLLAGVCGWLRPHMRFFLLALVLLYASYLYLIYDVQHNPNARFLAPDFGIEYGSFFCYGALLYLFQGTWFRHPLRLFLGLIMLAGVLLACHQGYAGLYMVLPFVVIRVGTWSTPVLRRFGRYGDFSYGMYIYAFMIQQWLTWLMGPGHPYWLGLLASMLCTLVCAVLSWHLVERPALNLKRRLPGATLPAGDIPDIWQEHVLSKDTLPPVRTGEQLVSPGNKDS